MRLPIKSIMLSLVALFAADARADELANDEEAAVRATVAAVLAKFEPQPAAADDTASQTTAAQTVAAQEDEALSAAKHAIIHEWQNWSALHSDELGDQNVIEHFFRHLQAKKPCLLNPVGHEYNTVRQYVTEK